MNVLCTFKIKIESQNSEHGCFKHIHTKIKMSTPSQEPLMSSKATNKDLKEMDVLYNQDREPKFEPGYHIE